MQAQITALDGRMDTLEDTLDEHKADEMPHKYTDSTTGKTYKWGMGSENGVPYFIREEVQ